MASLVVRTGGIRFGIRMARPKFLAVYGSTALSMAPSRTCRCQSSGLRIVIRVVMTHSPSSPRRRGPMVPHTQVSGIWVPACAGTTAGRIRVSTRHLSDRRRSRDQRVGGPVVDHRAGEIGDARKSLARAPLFQPIDDRDHAGGIAESQIADHYRAGARQHVLDHVLDLHNAAAA